MHNEYELQDYFISRISNFVQSHNRSIIGWNEIIEGGLVANATVGSGIIRVAAANAASSNYDVIMTPTQYCYFDYYQGIPLQNQKQ